MSTKSIRKDPSCLNCGSSVEQRYCGRCGQENIEPHETFTGLLRHFLEDLFHFDGKFFVTAKLLFTRPGYLSNEYSKGRRNIYFHPIRMYLFCSALFFFIFFSFFFQKVHPENFYPYGGHHQKLSTAVDKKLPANQNWLLYKIDEKLSEFRSNPDGGAYMFWKVVEQFLHWMPYLLFVSLPIFTFYLSLIHKKLKFYYSDHAIFLTHLYVFSFILLMVAILLSKVLLNFNLAWLFYLLFILYATYYCHRAMLKFYKQSLMRTILNFVLFNMLATCSLLILFGLFFIVALIKT